MKGLAGGLVVSLVCAAPLLAQDRDRSLERIRLALHQPLPIGSSGVAVQGTVPKKLGIVTFVPPTGRGEMIRVAIPIGDLVSRAFKGVAAANHRREEAAARREVEAALTRFVKQQADRKQ